MTSSRASSGMLNRGTLAAPSLTVYLNADNLVDLRSDSVWRGESGLAMFTRLKKDGFQGIQLTSNEPLPEGATFPYCGLDRISTPGEANDVARRHAERGDSCITVHAGWGWEDDAEVDRLVAAILEASHRNALPIFVETHRATITQDMWRTVQITKRFPEVRFNGDFSHYYCGQELAYGDWDKKLAFLQPIFDRVGFMHGRISSPGCIQAPIGRDLRVRPPQAHGGVDYLRHFRDLWTAAMGGFLRSAGAGDVLIFAPELLPGTHYYARLFPDDEGHFREETDRYAQALLYVQLAHECFTEARRRMMLEP